MESIALKQTDLTVSRLCIGGCPAGEYGWGNVSRAEVEQAMLHAVEHGINFFDTADTYGLGRSEETLGDTLRPYRDRVVIATKFGVRVENGKTWYDNSPAYLQASLAASLKRLKTDHLGGLWLDMALMLPVALWFVQSGEQGFAVLDAHKQQLLERLWKS